MFYLVSYSEEYVSLAIHKDSVSKEECQEELKELLISRIQSGFGMSKETAEAVYQMAKEAKTPDEEEAVLSKYGIDIHVFDCGASIDDGSYMDTFQIIDYVPNQKR